MVNCITLYKVFKTDANLHHTDMMMHVFCHLLQDIIIDVGNLKSDVLFRSLHGKSLFLYTHSSRQPQKENWRCKSGNWRSHTVWHVDPTTQCSYDPCSKNKCHSVPSVGAAANYSCSRKTQCFWSKFHPLLIIQANMTLVFHMNHYIFIHNKHERYSLICEPHSSLESNICILPARLEKVTLRVDQNGHHTSRSIFFCKKSPTSCHILKYTDDSKTPIINANIILIRV